jgi:organic hydroperoxide reductase OsmC/OhrA
MANLNGIDMNLMQGIIENVRKDPKAGMVSFRTVTNWEGGTLSQSQARKFSITIDEPTTFSGQDKALNPQEMMLSGLAA